MNRNWAIFFLLAVVGVSILLGLTLPSTGFDYDFEKFFKPDDKATQYFQRHRETFGTDNDFVLIGIVSERGVFDPSFLKDVDSLTKAFAEVSFVKDVISPTNATIRIRAPLTGSVFETPLIRGKRNADSLRVFSDPSVVDNLFSRSKKAISIALITEPKLSKNKSDVLDREVREAISQFEFDEIHLAGRAIGQVVYVNKIQGEFVLFMGISLIFITVLLFFMFRSLPGVLIPLGTVLLAVVWSIGFLNLSGKGISILLNMLPPVIFVVGMSDAVHLYSRFLEELHRGSSKKEAIHQTIFDTGLATMLTSITTAIGFASLYLTGIPALQEFGVFTALGVLAAFVISITLLPAWLVLAPIPQRSLRATKSGFWENKLKRLLDRVLLQRKRVFLISGLLTLLFAAGVSQLELNNFLLEDLREGEPLREDFAFFDSNFSGVRPFEVGVELKKEGANFFEEEHLLALRKIEKYLTDEYGAGALLSPLGAARELNRMDNGGKNAFYTLPEKDRKWDKISRNLEKLAKNDLLHPVLAKNGRYARISGRTNDLGGKTFQAKDASFRAFLAETGLDETYTIEVTGTGTLIDRTNQNLVGSLLKGLGTAFALIAILMGIIFKSVRMVIIAFIPNLMPLLAIGAVMYLLGIDLKLSTGIIFTIAFGIAVDDTIHLLSRYRLELRKGRPARIALNNAFIHTGKALIVTSIILFGGFISLCFSTFQSTFYIGLLVTLTLGFALVFDLVLLPALVYRPADSDPGS